MDNTWSKLARNGRKWSNSGKQKMVKMLHDGQQSRVFTHDEFAKPAWKITHFDHSQAILQGPGGKQVVITSP